jgi:hypothetical protein
MPPRHRPRYRPPPEKFGRYHLFVILMALIYAATVMFGVYLLTDDGAMATTRYGPEELKIRGLVMVMSGVPLCFFYAIALFVPKRPWGWVYGLVLIIIGLTSCCTWPLTIPLVRRWFLPSYKAYFRMR